MTKKMISFPFSFKTLAKKSNRPQIKEKNMDRKRKADKVFG